MPPMFDECLRSVTATLTTAPAPRQMSMCSEVSEALYAVGLRAPVALTHRVPDPVALLQRFRPRDHGHVDEQVVTSGVRGDEPEPAVAVVTCDDALAGACGLAP